MYQLNDRCEILRQMIVAQKNPCEQKYLVQRNIYFAIGYGEARSNIMWTATRALNKLVEKGKSTDWQTHMIGQAIGAYTNATHGMTLSAVTMRYLRHILPYGLAKFKRYAINVWNVTPDGKSDGEIANEGLCVMEVWARELGLVMNLADLGVTKDMIESIANATLIMEGGYKILTRDEIVKILGESM